MPSKRLAMRSRMMANVMATMEIQQYSSEYAAGIVELFHQSVHAIDQLVYSAEQKRSLGTNSTGL